MILQEKIYVVIEQDAVFSHQDTHIMIPGQKKSSVQPIRDVVWLGIKK